MKEIPLVDTIEVWEYPLKFNHNTPIDFPYDANFEIMVVGFVVYFYLLISDT